MKKVILFCIAIILMISVANAQKKQSKSSSKTYKTEYDSLWKKVDSFYKESLPKSALTVIESIYTKAKTEQNNPQFVKAIVYKAMLTEIPNKDKEISQINILEEETQKTSNPVIKAILNSITANCYWEYYTNNRWRINDRTNTANFEKKDIETWTATDFLKQTINLYLNALNNKEILQKIAARNYSPILLKGKKSEIYRPSLYDLLAHQALSFFMYERNTSTRALQTFDINKPEYFTTAYIFCSLKITSDDSLSTEYYTLKILQDLIKFHLKDPQQNALVDLDLIRLSYIFDQSNCEFKDSLYLQALLLLKIQYENDKILADIDYELADYYQNKGNKYDSKISEKYKWELKKAVEICENNIMRFPDSQGAANCKVILQQIKSPKIDIKIEAYNIPNKPIKALIEYKNTNELYFKIVKINQKINENLYDWEKKKNTLKSLIANKSEYDWNQSFVDDADFHLHSTEIKISPLNVGQYVILVSTGKDFSLTTDSIMYTTFQITNLNVIYRKLNDSNFDIYVLNRETGEPIKGAAIVAITSSYIYQSGTNEDRRKIQLLTDENGYVYCPNVFDKKESYYLRFEVNYKSEQFITEKKYYYRNKESGYALELQTYFFTDRQIYRPGQTVYFKGILTKSDGKTVEIIENKKCSIKLQNANYQIVAEQNLVSNEYGSVSGSFVIPQSSMTGNYHIISDNGGISFIVEEYKRPKFEVSFQNITGSYKLNETITVKGKAKSFAGSNIDGAKVSFIVMREANFPYRNYWSRYSYRSSSSQIITNGEITTNEKGEFEIKFIAHADANISKENMPVFNYTINADVTDINGETHSTQTTVSVGYTSLLLAISLPEKYNTEQPNTVKIETTNLNGNPEPATVKVSVYRLTISNQIFKNQYWQFPDKPILNLEEYRLSYPNDPYKNEDLISSFPKEKLIFERTYQTADTNIQDFSELKTLTEGMYVMEASTKDSFGENIETKTYFTAFSPSSKTMPTNSAFWFTPLKSSGEPGEKASFLIGSKYSNINILFEIEHNDTIVEKQWIKLSNAKQKFEIPIKEEYRGNFNYKLICIKNNRLYVENKIVAVPRTNKQLDIRFESFRNKLEPGQKEEWKIKITGKKGEKVASEMLTTMYDASLDAFAYNVWNFDIYNTYNPERYWSFENISTSYPYIFTEVKVKPLYLKSRNYDMILGIDGFGRYNNYNKIYLIEKDELVLDVEESKDDDGYFSLRGRGDYMGNSQETKKYKIHPKQHGSIREIACPSFGGEEIQDSSVIQYVILGNDNRHPLIIADEKSNYYSSITNIIGNEIIPRTNFNETAFFFPNLETDTAGNVIVRFTAPESLTRWKMMGLAHTQDLKYGIITKELVTQKKLMILSNPPRFLREGDKIVFSAKVSNLSEIEQIGKAELQLFDASTGKSVDVEFSNNTKELDFQIKAGQSQAISWELEIPEGFSALEYKIFARTNESSDGESNTIPILTNRTLVTESMPLPINGNESKSFSFTKLKDSESSSTLKNHKYTLEFTSNPAWYAIQALPYLMEYPYECSEQTFSRYYANTVAAYLANSNPKIKSVFESWKTQSPEALLSNLEKNQELKSLMLEETPWVMEANNESERKKRLGLLFDLNRLAAEKQATESKLLKKQKYNGGWSWFDDGPESQYITQHIVCGFGKLIHLNMIDLKEENQIKSSLQKALKFLDKEMKKEYDDIMKYSKKPEDNHLNSEIIQYLYCRSFFNSIFPIDVQNKKAYEYFMSQADKYWTSQNFYSRGMIALSLARKGEKETPNLIIKSLKENAKYSDEMGMYWENESGWYWYQAPIETQALLIELFDEVAHDLKSVEEMKKWLLKQKQTQDWKTTKATVEACYALMLRGSSQLTSTQAVEIKIANVLIDPKKLDNSKVEAGTGYFKTSWSGDEIKPSMSEITITKKDSGIAWGAVYWQYFENLDKITYAQTPLSIKKNLFVERNSANGPVLQFISDTTQLKVGDKITVRIELRVDRDMEYVHMKDMRASSFEPINVLSQYKWQGGLGYYESTRDAATNFFFPSLNKGTYVFEYSMFVNNSGDFSNGITTIQCMYAPEFTAHSEGVRVKVGK